MAHEWSPMSHRFVDEAIAAIPPVSWNAGAQLLRVVQRVMRRFATGDCKVVVLETILRNCMEHQMMCRVACLPACAASVLHPGG
jgi:hypothetical protein